MEFSIEALNGIAAALSYEEVQMLAREGVKRGIYKMPKGSERRRAAGQQLLIDMGYIMPFEPASATDLGAAEYDEAIAAQTLMEDTCGS